MSVTRKFADSGDLEADMPVLLEAIGEATTDKKMAIAIITESPVLQIKLDIRP